MCSSNDSKTLSRRIILLFFQNIRRLLGPCTQTPWALSRDPAGMEAPSTLICLLLEKILRATMHVHVNKDYGKCLKGGGQNFTPLTFPFWPQTPSPAKRRLIPTSTGSGQYEPPSASAEGEAAAKQFWWIRGNCIPECI